MTHHCIVRTGRFAPVHVTLRALRGAETAQIRGEPADAIGIRGKALPYAPDQSEEIVAVDHDVADTDANTQLKPGVGW